MALCILTSHSTISVTCCVVGTRVSVYPSVQTVVASSNVTFHCLVTTDPQETSSLQIYWKRDGQWLVVTDLCTNRCLITTFDGRNSSLLVTGVTVVDSGQYTCRAISSVDAADGTTVLLVKGPCILSISLSAYEGLRERTEYVPQL